MLNASYPTIDVQAFWDVWYKRGLAEERMDDAIVTACGASPDDVSTWPFDDIDYDPYDSSFELGGCTDGWEPPTLTVFWGMGFQCCWLRYTDGTERFAYKGDPETLHPPEPVGEHHRTRDNENGKKAAKLEKMLRASRTLLQNWTSKQGHERCWYYPDVFDQLHVTLGLELPARRPTIPQDQFEAGCLEFQRSEYAKR